MNQLDSVMGGFLSVNVKDLQGTQFFELKLVIAFLKWLLVEEYKHHPSIKRDYPTRSLWVWSVVFILSKIGFLVEASTTPITEQETWTNQLSQTEIGGLWRVHLVTSSSVFADRAYDQKNLRRTDTRERRLIPIGNIPTMAFDYFGFYDAGDVTIADLNEVLLNAFNEVTEHLPLYPYLQDLAGLSADCSIQRTI